MKLWVSASAVGLSMAYLASACSSSPPADTGNPFNGGGAPAAGATAAGAAPVGGAAPGAGAGGSAPTAGAPAAGGTGGDPTVPGGGAAGQGVMAGAGGAPVGGAETKVDCPANVDGHCSSGVTYPTYPGYTLKVVEDFPEAIDLNNDPIWTWSDGIPNDSQTGFAEDHITFANGHMILKADSTCAAAIESKCYAGRPSYAESYSDEAIPRSRPPYGVVSGEFRTKYNNYRYGRYEVRLKAPDQPMGNFLSTMFVFRTPTNIAWNEIDLELEPNQQGKINVNTVNAPNGAKAYPGGDAQSLPVAGLVISEFHTYAFTWTANSIDWYVDGSTTPTYTHASGKQPAIPNLSAKIMLNLWVFHNKDAFGDPSKNVFPLQSEYDYFHFYKQDAETYPCSPTPTCLNKANNDYTAAAQNNSKESPYLK